MTLRHTLSASAAALALGLAGAMTITPSTASAQFSIGFSINIAPPVIPVFVQPAMPGYGYIWTPGYWAWDPGFGYYWVPGEWVLPPRPGLLWTPGYWAWRHGVFGFIGGYWGPTVGYYGGVDYGYGYGGVGYQGAEWRGGRIYYNTTVNNFGGARIATTFSRPFARRTTSRASFNGGPGGLTVRPTATEHAASRQQHIQPVATQTERVRAAAANPAFRATSVAHGGATAAVTAMHRNAARTAGAASTRVPNAMPSAPNAAVAGRAEVGASVGARTPISRTEHGRATPTERAAPAAPTKTERAAPTRGNVRTSTPYERGGPGAQLASPYERGGPPTRENNRQSMAPRSQPSPESTPRMQPRPGGGMTPEGRPAGGERAAPNAGSPGREPSARPEGGGRPSASPKGDEKNKPPG